MLKVCHFLHSVVAAMKFNENLQELYISNNNLLPEDAQNLGAILRINHTLKVLDIKDNNIQVRQAI